jgi:hypothetical protein
MVRLKGRAKEQPVTLAVGRSAGHPRQEEFAAVLVRGAESGRTLDRGQMPAEADRTKDLIL